MNRTRARRRVAASLGPALSIVAHAGATHRHRLGLRGAAVALTALLAVTVAAAGHLVVFGLVVVVVTGLATFAGGNDLFVSLVFYGSCILLWLLSGASPTTWWSIPIALELWAIHSVRTLAVMGPPEAAVPRQLALAWLRRTAWVAAGTVAVGVAGLALAGASVSGTSYAASGLLFAVMVGLAMLPLLYPREVPTSRETPERPSTT